MAAWGFGAGILRGGAIRRLAAVLAVVVLGAAPGMAPAQEAAVQEAPNNILTGGPTGTYIQIGRDLAKLTESCGILLGVHESAGSLENFLGVRNRPNTQFGIVQSDVLEYLRTYAADDPAIARAVKGVRIAFPLYNEEVHLLARKDIPDLAGLAGKKVAIGVQDSGTFLTASLILDLTGVKVGERVEISPADALPKLLDGSIDAFFYVAGAPASLFAEPALTADKVHLLALTDPTLTAVYDAKSLAPNTYPFQPQPVSLVSVKAVLMTYDYDPRKNAYHRRSCEMVAQVSNLILTRFEELKASGHPKWKDVDLTAIPQGWTIGNCVNAGLAEDFQQHCQPAASAEEPSGANAAYRARICATIGC